jgi:hypothetical protein
MTQAQLTITSYEFKCDYFTAVYESCVDPEYVYVSPDGLQHPVRIDGDDWSFPTLTRIVAREEILDYIRGEDGDGYPIRTGKYRDVISYVDAESGEVIHPSTIRRMKETQGTGSVRGEFFVNGPIEIGKTYRFEDCEFPAPLIPLAGAFLVVEYDPDYLPSVQECVRLGPMGQRYHKYDGAYCGRFVSAGPVEIQPLQAEDALTQ